MGGCGGYMTAILGVPRMTATGHAASGGSSQPLDPQNLPPDCPHSALP
jgi:hypothetical protein